VSLLIQSAPPRERTDPNSVQDRTFFNPYVMPQDAGTIAWRALELQAEGMDQVLDVPLRYGLGYGLEAPTINAICGSRFAGHRDAYWGGSGGSIVFNDLDLRLTFAYMMNRHFEAGFTDQRGLDLVSATYDSLAVAA
jgi:CubicO group peptidase (beta-lactamase class C family)